MALLTDLTLGNYIPGDSPVHALDPRVKMAGALALMAAPFLLKAPASVLLHTLFLLGAASLSRIPLGRFLASLRVFLWLFFFTAVLHLFFTPGTPLFTGTPLEGFPVTKEGLAGGVLTAWRLVAVIALSALLTHTTTPLGITRAMESLLSPLERVRFPVQDFSLMMMIALRFIPVLAEEADRVWKAQKARGADLASGGLVRRGRALTALFLPLFAGIFRRADELALALEARGYVPGGRRTSMNPLRWTRRETVALFLLLAWGGALWAAGPFP